MKLCQSLFNSMSPFSRKKVYGGEFIGYGRPPGAHPNHSWSSNGALSPMRIDMHGGHVAHQVKGLQFSLTSISPVFTSKPTWGSRRIYPPSGFSGSTWTSKAQSSHCTGP